MLWIDYLIVGIVLVSAIIGLFRGFLREVISLIALVAAFLVSYLFGQSFADMLSGLIATPTLRMATAYAGLFVLILFLGAIINFIVGRAVSQSGLAGTDRVIGLVFGVLRGAALAIILILLLGLTPAPQDAWWQQSVSIRLLAPYAEWAKGLLPADVAQHFSFSTEPVPPQIEEPVTPEPAKDKK